MCVNWRYLTVAAEVVSVKWSDDIVGYYAIDPLLSRNAVRTVVVRERVMLN